MLFPEIWPRSTAPRPPQILAPLAAFSLDLIVNGESIIGNHSGLNPTEQGLVWGLADDLLEVEILTAAVAPNLPPGMFVDGCVAALCRLRARQAFSDYAFVCTHDRQEVLGPGGPCSGQHLNAQEWSHSGTILTLGTQDLEAMIANRRGGGCFPLRLARHAESFESDDAKLATYLPSGFTVHPPALEPNEVIQVQFVAAWAPETSPELSTWFAVHFAPGDLVGKRPGGPSRI